VPEDAYYADGYQGEQEVIIPSRKLVVVRFGLTVNPLDMEFKSFLSKILAERSASQLGGWLR